MPQHSYSTWQDFARAASIEQDSKKLAYLIQQLNRALDEECQRRLVTKANREFHKLCSFDWKCLCGRFRTQPVPPTRKR